MCGKDTKLDVSRAISDFYFVEMDASDDVLGHQAAGKAFPHWVVPAYRQGLFAAQMQLS
jgi:hypothetical protein